MIPLRTLIYDARTELSQPPKHTISVLDVLRSIAIGLVVIGHAGGQFDQDLSTSLPNFISAKFFHVLSRLSYGVYLNHFMLLDDVHGAAQAVAGTGSFGFVACSVAGLALSIAVAFVTFAFIE